MSSAVVKSHITPEEYLALERKSPFKNEYDNGVITAMAGTTLRHNRIVGNLYSEIRAQLQGRPCGAYFSDVRVGVVAAGLYTYPDVVAVCGEPRLLDDELDTLLNPTVIVEVLSPSTEAYDRGRKFAHYRRLDSLREYVLVAQDRVLVERYVRQGEQWILTELGRLDDELLLTSIDCRVPLREIYAQVLPLEGEKAEANGPGDGNAPQ